MHDDVISLECSDPVSQAMIYRCTARPPALDFQLAENLADLLHECFPGVPSSTYVLRPIPDSEGPLEGWLHDYWQDPLHRVMVHRLATPGTTDDPRWIRYFGKLPKYAAMSERGIAQENLAAAGMFLAVLLGKCRDGTDGGYLDFCNLEWSGAYRP